MAHQITSEGGVNLSPSAPGQIGAEGGVDLAPTAPGQIGAEGGSDLAPTAPARIASNGVPGNGVMVSGTLVPDAAGWLPLNQIDFNGRPSCSWPPDVDELPADSKGVQCFYFDGRWRLVIYPAGTSGPASRWRAAAGTELTPDMAVGWEPDPASDEEPTGSPIISYYPPPDAPDHLTSAGAGDLSPVAPPDITPDVNRGSVLLISGLEYLGSPLGDVLVFEEDEEQDGHAAFTNDHPARLFRVFHESGAHIIEYRENGQTLGTWASLDDPALVQDVENWTIGTGDVGGAPVVFVSTIPVPPALTAEGGTNLAPTSPGHVTAEGGVSLSPTAPAQITAETIY